MSQELERKKAIAREIVNRNLDELGTKLNETLNDWHRKVTHYLKTGEEL